jgi:hypothetical protein
VIEKGRVFQWDIMSEVKEKEEFKNDSEFIKELDHEVEGKPLSQHKIKDIDSTSNCLFLTTGT